MLNLADLSALLTILAGILTGLVIGKSEKEPWWIVLVFILIGTLLGYFFAVQFHKLAYRLLDDSPKSKFLEISSALAYLFLPIVSLSVTCAVIGCILFLIARLT